MSNKNQEYAERYSEFAMEQMRRYGIPASVTLAQGILESANGQSQLARNENNHFGIKATSSWIDNGGRYGLYSDDKPNEKFCSYDSVGDSYEHHSKFLKQNSRYAQCFTLSPDDYKGWAQGLDKAGYATAGKYAPSLIAIIERNGLDRYDRMVMEEMRTNGRKIPDAETAIVTGSNDYSFPVKRDEFLFVTSLFGTRTDPMDSSKTQTHKGIDIRADNDPVLATENNGKVVAVNNNAATPGGKSVTVEYSRENGDKIQISYCHLNTAGVSVGDTVNAGQQIGVSGNTGTRTTGPHLHFRVKQINSDGSQRDLDPAAYLADIAKRGNINLQLLHDGKDLMARYKSSGESNGIDTSLSPEEWMKKLLASEDSGVSIGSGDPLMEMVVAMFTALMGLATQIDGKDEKERMSAATNAAIDKVIDLTPILTALKECSLTINPTGEMVLGVDDGKTGYNHTLTKAELNRLSTVLHDETLSPEEKRQRVASVVGQITLTEQMSRNYEQGLDERQGKQDNLQIR